ncbi:MAG: hypothetical protein MI702_02110, partial [Chlorobiales bacterium]|nr:hypothetical protein [Chlorobiales bacterium]
MRTNVGIHNKHSLKMLFIDEISLLSLLRICLLIPSPETVIYFEPLAESREKMLRAFQALRLIPKTVRQNTDYIGLVRNGTKEGMFLRLIADGRGICKRIRKNHTANHPLIKAVGSFWDSRKVQLFFDKIIEGRHVSGEVTRECIRIGLTRWVICHRLNVSNSSCALMIQRKKWFPYIREYALQNDLVLMSYGSFFLQGCTKIFRILSRCFLRLHTAYHDNGPGLEDKYGSEREADINH